jgi:hypothetical protein
VREREGASRSEREREGVTHCFAARMKRQRRAEAVGRPAYLQTC